MRRAAARALDASAAGLVFGSLAAVLVTDLSTIAGRPGIIPPDAPPGTLEALSTLPGPAPILLAGLLPAGVFLVAGRALRRDTDEPPALHSLRLAIGRVADIGLVALVAAILALSILPGLVEIGGWRLVAITSGSMEPAYPPGAMILISPVEPADVAVGDAILFRDEAGHNRTHRVTVIATGKEGSPLFTVRGDAAPAPDADPVPAGAVVGRVVAAIPLLGALRAWLFAPAGILAAILLAIVFARGTATRRR